MIIRVEKRQRYTIIDNELIEDAALSFRDLGVLTYLLSRPDNWEASYRHLATLRNEGEAAVRTSLNSIEQAGYLERRRERDKSGRLVWVQVIHEKPAGQTMRRESPHGPCGDSPRLDNQRLENAPLISTEEEVLTEQTTDSSLAPLAERVEAGSDNDPQFAAFWSAYPSKKDKGGSRKAWRAALKKAPGERIIEGVRRFAADPNLPEAAYIPHPKTWLNGERWNDGPLPSRIRRTNSRDVAAEDLLDQMRLDQMRAGR